MARLTTDIAREYLVEIFEHEYEAYINTQLAGDFACALMEAFENRLHRVVVVGDNHDRIMEDWEKRDADKNLIDCIGKDIKRHVCYPWEDKCYCGEPVLRKKLLRDDIELFSCYRCTY